MEILTVGTAAFSVYIRASELKEYDMEPGSVTAAQARRLLKRVLPELEKEEGPVRVELFPGRDEMMLFVCLNRGRAEFFKFSGIEEAAAGASECGADMPSSLYYMDGRYILAAHPWRGDAELAPLDEFGTREHRPPEYELYLGEHGRVIMECEAISRLRTLFVKAGG